MRKVIVGVFVVVAMAFAVYAGYESDEYDREGGIKTYAKETTDEAIYKVEMTSSYEYKDGVKTTIITIKCYEKKGTQKCPQAGVSDAP